MDGGLAVTFSCSLVAAVLKTIVLLLAAMQTIIEIEINILSLTAHHI